MELDRNNRYEQLYNIKLSDFYTFVTDVMSDFGYSLYRTIREIDSKRRLESWVYGPDGEQKALVWIEITSPEDTLDPYLTTDVLRTMNDENVTRLFFFTNGNLSEEDKEVLEGNNHFIFSTEEIVETLIAIDSKRSSKITKKRKPAKVPTATVLIRNFFKTNEIRKKQIRLKTSATPDLLAQYSRLIKRILNEIDKVSDINDIPNDIREKLKKVQIELLPELAKTPSYVFPRHFDYLRDLLFNLIKVTVIYIGNFIDYESEDDLKHNREVIDDILLKLDEVDEKILSYKSDMMFQAEKNSVRIIITSAIITFVALILLIIVKFGR